MPVDQGLTTRTIGKQIKLPIGPVPMEAGSHAMQPIYTTANTNPAYQLNWGLTIFWRDGSLPGQTWLQPLQQATETDGVRILQHRFSTRGASQFFLSTKPHASPSEIIRSVKGRLQHLIGSQMSKAFQRNYAIRSVGEVTRSVVEKYVTDQLGHHRMADPRVQQMLSKYQRTYDVDLKAPVISSHGEYWYNLHVVLVNEERWMEIREAVLDSLAAMIEGVSAKY